MNQILANYSVSITEFKKNPSAIIHNCEGEAVAILNHNKPEAYLVSAEEYERILDALENIELGRTVRERLSCKNMAVEVDINDL